MCEVGASVARVDVSDGPGEDVVLPSMEVLEVLLLLTAEVGTVALVVMVVISSVGGGEVLVVRAMLVVEIMVVPSVGNAVLLVKTMVPVVVVIVDGMRLVAVLCDVGDLVARATVGAVMDVVLLPVVILEVVVLWATDVGTV